MMIARRNDIVPQGKDLITQTGQGKDMVLYHILKTSPDGIGPKAAGLFGGRLSA